MEATVKKKYVFYLFILYLTFGPFLSVNAQEGQKDASDYYEDIDFSEIQKVVDEATNYSGSLDFKEYVSQLMKGEKSFSLVDIGEEIKKTIGQEFAGNKKIVLQLITIAIIAGIFTNFVTVFKNSQVAETGFYISYLFLFSVLMGSFYNASAIAGKILDSLFLFMKAVVPVYFLTMSFSSGAGTSLVFYQSTLVIIAFVEFLLLKIILPMIQIYFVLVLVNHLSKEDMLSKLTELLENIVSWSLKTLVGLVIGINVVQGLVVPAANQFKNSLVLRSAQAIPVVGNALGGVTETVLGAGFLIKNAVGVAGLLGIITICFVPLIKLFFYVAIYKITVTLIQPISDKRILKCVGGASKAAGLLFYTGLIAAILFLVTIVIMTASTGRISI